MSQDPRADIGSADCQMGEPLTWTVTIKDGSGSPVDLTAYGTTWAADLRQSYSMQPAVVFAIDASGAASGVLVLSLTGTQTAAMATSTGDHTMWFFDIQVTGGTVSPQFPFQGSLNIWKVYTHA